MSNIQGSVNQLLGTLAVLTQLPSGQELKKKRLLDKQGKAVDAALQGVNVEPGQEDTAQGRYQRELGREKADVLRRQYEANPTKGGLTAYLRTRSAYYDEPIASLPEDEEVLAEERAMSSMRSKGVQQVQQAQKRRYFMDYLRNEPTSLGGTVGELDPNLQKTIAGQYNRSQRKALMDRIDRERGGSK